MSAKVEGDSTTGDEGGAEDKEPVSTDSEAARKEDDAQGTSFATPQSQESHRCQRILFDVRFEVARGI